MNEYCFLYMFSITVQLLMWTVGHISGIAFLFNLIFKVANFLGACTILSLRHLFLKPLFSVTYQWFYPMVGYVMLFYHRVEPRTGCWESSFIRGTHLYFCCCFSLFLWSNCTPHISCDCVLLTVMWRIDPYRKSSGWNI